ncbi:MAG: ATPase, partial [Faecalimonas sp.]|nr:ATPase [Faecalimonas sp.]
EELFYSPDFHSLLQARLTPLSEELQTWMTMPYDKNANHPENLNNKAYSGNMVRSKSEVLIDMFLFKNKIPFRYECLLDLDGIMMYPDFTIRHPKTGETYYWEHFGLMDNPTYSKNACSKLQHYISSGIIPSIQLITTYETKDNPLSAEKVEKIVEEYFL